MIFNIADIAEEILVNDPFYNLGQGSRIEKELFFKELYVEPKNRKSQEIITEITKELLNLTKSKILFITGYAGCGKSVFIQKMLHDLHIKDSFARNTYILVYDYEQGANTTGNNLIDRIVRSLARNMTNDIMSSNEKYELFQSFVNEYSIELSETLDSSECIRRFFTSDDSFKGNLPKDKKILEDAISDKIRNILENKVEPKFTSKMQFILAVDCLWRTFQYINSIAIGKPRESLLYLAFDNLDIVENYDLINDFVSGMHTFRRNLDRFLGLIGGYKGERIPFRFILTARKITFGELAGAFNEVILDEEKMGIGKYYDISDFSKYPDIVNKRYGFVKKLKDSDRNSFPDEEFSKLELYRNLCKVSFLDETYKRMFNYNYRECIGALSNILSDQLKSNSNTIQQCIDLMDSGVDTDRKNKEIDKKASHTGASSMFIRLLFDYFYSYKVFDSFKLIDVTKQLNDNIAKARINELTSPSRILLTCIYNWKGPEPCTLDKIYDFFQHIYSPDEICSLLIELHNRNASWRRTIYFSSINLSYYNADTIPTCLKLQTEVYKQNEKDNRVNQDEKYATVAICEAGMVLIDEIITDFEFISLRCNPKSLPLYDITNLNISNGEYGFQIIIREVKKSVQNCVDKLAEFNRRVMDVKKFTRDKYFDSILIGLTRTKNKQYHEERMIFEHIYYLEDYRWFLINHHEVRENEKQRKEINQILTDYIDEYLQMLDSIDYLKGARRDIRRKLHAKVGRIIDSEYTDYNTRIET